MGMEESFQGTCFGRAFLKYCQYVNVNERVNKGFNYASIRYV
jgi:hypothetical protein